MLSPRQMLAMAGAFAVGMTSVGAGLLWAGAATPQSVEVLGFSGNAGEWELTATLTRDADTRQLAGPMKMAHVGWCSQEGPQQKSGDLRLQFHRLTSGLDATLNVDGVECSFSARLTDAYEGKMACPGRRPVQMLLWIK